MHKTSEQLKKQEEMVERQEAMRRKTAEIEAELRTKTELAKTRAEAEGRIRQERENHDLILQKVRLEAVEQRDTVLKAIADGGKLLGEGLSSYLRDGEKLRNTAFIVSLAAAGIYSAKTGAGIAGRFIEVSRFYRAGGGARSMHTPFSPRARIHRRSVSHDIR
jgi:ATPase family AAA domain-containing protein 3A/B